MNMEKTLNEGEDAVLQIETLNRLTPIVLAEQNKNPFNSEKDFKFFNQNTFWSFCVFEWKQSNQSFDCHRSEVATAQCTLHTT